MVSVFLSPNPSDRTNVYKMSMSMLKICCQLACVDFVPEGGEAATSSVSSWSSPLGGGKVVVVVVILRRILDRRYFRLGEVRVLWKKGRRRRLS